MKPSVFLFVALTGATRAAPDGAQLFTTNCAACHLLDQLVVGPSLVEMRKIYDGKPDDFVKWAVAPQKKRKNLIEMPSMVHVGDEGLRAVYEHVMEISEGVKEVKVEKGDPFLTSPTHTVRPQVQRIFMPNAGPAAIAVALDENVSVCWDAGECRLRYAWTGGFIDGFSYWAKNGRSVAKIKGEVRYTEAEPVLGLEGARKFHGYSLKNGLPVFRYSIGETEVTEALEPFKNGEGFSRTFTLDPEPGAGLTVKPPADQKEKAAFLVNKGDLDENPVKLTAAEAAEFTIATTFK